MKKVKPYSDYKIKPVSVELEYRDLNNPLDSEQLLNTIDKLFNKTNRFNSNDKTFVFGGRAQKHITLEEVVAYFADNPHVTVVNAADCQKYRCGVKVD